MAGVDFYNKMVEIATIPSVRILSDWAIPYRDDNRYFWEFSENMFESQGIDYLPSSLRSVRRNVCLMEFLNEIECEMEDGNPQEVLVLSTELFPYEDMGISYNEMKGIEPVSDPFHCNEWDYHLQLARPDWATVIERKQGRGDPEVMDEILTKHKPIA
jgi:hypothetical protein